MVIGAPLNDERLARINELAQENSLMVGLLSSNRTLELIANSSTAPAEVLDAVRQPSVEGAIRTAVETNALTVAEEPSSGYLFAVAPLQGYGKTQALLIATVPASLVLGLPRQLATTIFGVTALGLLLVAFGGYLLGNYLSRPIGELEDGLLAIINGDSELRFQIEHSELGGLVFRINSLLNAMMGVAEESTDDQGGSAATPSAHTFQDPLGVDESLLVSDQADPGASATLAREPADQYYRRVFEEFIAAKRQLGDPVDHIGFESFRERIEQSERDLLQSHSRPVRFRVAVRDGAVVLTAVPIG
jgi:methyl-accepting chemotaxis protein